MIVVFTGDGKGDGRKQTKIQHIYIGVLRNREYVRMREKAGGGAAPGATALSAVFGHAVLTATAAVATGADRFPLSRSAVTKTGNSSGVRSGFLRENRRATIHSLRLIDNFVYRRILKTYLIF